MLKQLALASTLALAPVGMAQAGSLQEPIIVAPPAAVYVDPGRDWSGFYAGINGAYGIINPPAFDYYGLGVHAGYLADMGSFVVGGEVNYEYVTVPTPAATLHRIGGDLILGYDAGDFLPHITAGASGLALTGGGVWNMGLSAGAGASVMVGDNIMLTGRYRYTHYNAFGGINAHGGKLMVSFRF